MKRYFQACIVLGLIVFCGGYSILNKPVVTEEVVEVAEVETPEETEGLDISNWKENHPKVRGIYVTGPTAGIDRMDEIIQLINDTELNAIVLDVKDDAGNVTFVLDNPDVQETEACVPYIHDIDGLLKKLKDNDIYVIARIPCFKDPILAKAYPELALTTPEGEPVTDAAGNAWVNPCKEEVWDYIISIASSCAELGFDEIQLDYVRFPVGQNAERADYHAPSDDENRKQYINSFLEKITSELHGKNVPVTADVFGTIIKSNLDSEHIGQDYVTLASHLDGLCPMIYPSHYANGEFGIEVPDAKPYETINASLMGSKEVLAAIPEEECGIIRPWLQAFTASWVEGYIEYDGAAIRKEIQAVYDSGYDEWILWNSKSSYSPEGLEKNQK